MSNVLFLRIPLNIISFNISLAWRDTVRLRQILLSHNSHNCNQPTDSQAFEIVAYCLAMHPDVLARLRD